MSNLKALRFPSREVLGELEEKKSIFLAHLVPIADFEPRLAALRALHPKAVHHVTAFRRMLPEGRIEEGAKDDGEPGGTSGMPSLRSLMGAGLVDVGLITVRYFGGTKLGTGGLARAYSGAANLAIQEAEAAGALETWRKIERVWLSAGFDRQSDLERLVADQGLEVLDRAYDEQGVRLHLQGALQDSRAALADFWPEADEGSSTKT